VYRNPLPLPLLDLPYLNLSHIRAIENVTIRHFYSKKVYLSAAKKQNKHHFLFVIHIINAFGGPFN
jgi:hypothetical protein